MGKKKRKKMGCGRKKPVRKGLTKKKNNNARIVSGFLCEHALHRARMLRAPFSLETRSQRVVCGKAVQGERVRAGDTIARAHRGKQQQVVPRRAELKKKKKKAVIS